MLIHLHVLYVWEIYLEIHLDLERWWLYVKVKITDDNGNILTIYGTYSADG